MKGLPALVLGIFGTFAFSWMGLILIPNAQIGHLDPQSDEEGTDIYPMPPSGMVARGRQVYAANGCFYCHSQQVRADYVSSDIERKWGLRRSAPRDYIFERPVLLGKMRTGPDLANVGHRQAASTEKEPGAAGTTPAAGASPQAATSPAPAAGAPSPSSAASASPASNAAASPAVAAKAPAASPAATGPSPAASTSPAPNASASPALAPTASPAAVAAAAGTPPVPNAAASPAANASPSPTPATAQGELNGVPLPYTAAWHHRHLYNPRSITADSNMPSYRFLYEKRRIIGEASSDALNFAGTPEEGPPVGWEIVPTYDGKCLVAYLMSLDQAHPLKEAKSVVAAAAPAPGKEAK